MPFCVLITGSTSGLGYYSALNLLKAGHTVIISSRSPANVEKAAAELQKQSGADPANVLTCVLDLGSLKTLKSQIETNLKPLLSRIEIVVANAGIQTPAFSVSDEGLEQTFATNHVGHFYLLKHIPRIKRLVIVSSGTHDPANHTGLPAPVFDLEKWAHPDAKTFDRMQAYTNSKLANVLFGYEFVKRNRKVSVALYDPGYCSDTGLYRDAPYLFQYLGPYLIKTFGYLGSWYHGSPYQMSDSKSSAEFFAKLVIADVEGEKLIRDPQSEECFYYSIKTRYPTSDLSKDKQHQKDLWEFTEKLTL